MPSHSTEQSTKSSMGKIEELLQKLENLAASAKDLGTPASLDDDSTMKNKLPDNWSHFVKYAAAKFVRPSEAVPSSIPEEQAFAWLDGIRTLTARKAFAERCRNDAEVEMRETTRSLDELLTYVDPKVEELKKNAQSAYESCLCDIESYSAQLSDSLATSHNALIASGVADESTIEAAKRLGMKSFQAWAEAEEDFFEAHNLSAGRRRV